MLDNSWVAKEERELMVWVRFQVLLEGSWTKAGYDNQLAISSVF